MNALPAIDYAQHPDYLGFRQKAEALAPRAWEKLAPLLVQKRLGMRDGAEAFLTRADSHAETTADALARNGVAGIRLPPRWLETLRTATRPAATTLATRLAEMSKAEERIAFPDTLVVAIRGGYAIPGHEDFAAGVRRVIDDAAVGEIAGAYYPGHRAEIVNVCLKHNIANHSMFQADGRETTRAAGIHIDSNTTAMLNVVIYLNEVGPENGPFSYVVGSNQWDFDPEDRAIRKAVDETGFGGQGGRKYFAALPAEFQRKAAFGWDLSDAAAAEMLRAERAFTSDQADMILFDSDGAHRGGNAQSGHRLAILFNMKMVRI